MSPDVSHLAGEMVLCCGQCSRDCEGRSSSDRVLRRPPSSVLPTAAAASQ